MAATRDPGIIPRNSQAALSPSSVEDGAASSARTAPPNRFLVVNGVEVRVRLKFCRTCKIHQPPRSHHCAVCDNCVDKFDQHCPWISQCVGLVYIAMLLCLTLTTEYSYIDRLVGFTHSEFQRVMLWCLIPCLCRETTGSTFC